MKKKLITADIRDIELRTSGNSSMFKYNKNDWELYRDEPLFGIHNGQSQPIFNIRVDAEVEGRYIVGKESLYLYSINLFPSYSNKDSAYLSFSIDSSLAGVPADNKIAEFLYTCQQKSASFPQIKVTKVSTSLRRISVSGVNDKITVRQAILSTLNMMKTIAGKDGGIVYKQCEHLIRELGDRHINNIPMKIVTI